MGIKQNLTGQESERGKVYKRAQAVCKNLESEEEPVTYLAAEFAQVKRGAMKRLCVFYVRADQWVGRKIEWIVCKTCQKQLRRGKRLKIYMGTR